MDQNIVHDGNKWSNTQQDRIEIEEYDLSWPEKFKTESRRLVSMLPDGLSCSVHHLGSTAIPGMAAKPIIDIFLTLDEYRHRNLLIEPLESAGYIFWRENPRKDRMFFVKGMPPFGPKRTHHVHVRHSHDVTDEMLFVEYLKKHPDHANDYMRLKRNLMHRYPTDRDAYTEAKKEFINEILKMARK